MTEEREALKGLLTHTFLFRGAPEEALEAALSDRRAIWQRADRKSVV